MLISGRLTITTPGTALQLALGINPKYNIEDRDKLPKGKTTVVAIEDNGTDVILGGAEIIAALAAREGKRMVPAQERVFHNRHLNDIWLDAVNAGDGVYFDFEACDPLEAGVDPLLFNRTSLLGANRGGCAC